MSDSEKGATFEVEVRKPDGSTVDVRLDDSLDVVAIDSEPEQRSGSIASCLSGSSSR